MGIKLIFRGVRGSYCVPGPATLRTGGNTTCIEVHAGGNTIILDAGTGIIEVGRQLALEQEARRKSDPAAHIVAAMFFSHMHHDHTQGFPFFPPVYMETTRLHIYGPRMMNTNFESGLANALLSPLFPVELADMRAQKLIHNIYENDVVLFPEPGGTPVMAKKRDDLSGYGPDIARVHCGHTYAHPNGGSLVYRIEHAGRSVVFATDVEGYVGGDQRLIRFAAGADVLIHDAQYEAGRYTGYPAPVQGFGHSTPEMAAEVARAAGVGRLFLTHHDPGSDDDRVEALERNAQGLFPKVEAAREGVTVEL